MVDAHVSGACVERHAGSSPVLGTLFVKRASFAEIAQLVEHNLAKVRVASSSLVFRSQEKATQVVFSFFYAFFLQEIFCISVAGIMRNLIYLRLQLRK